MPQFNQKGIAHLLLILIVLAAIGLAVYLVGTKTNLFPSAQETNLTAEPPDSHGFIIQFKDEPRVQTQQERKGNEAINRNHEQAKADVLSRLDISGSENNQRNSKTNSPDQEDLSGLVLGDFTKVFNGIALNITQEQAETLEASPYVKKIYPNLLVKTTLMESVPLIQTDKVWGQTDQSGIKVKGKSVNVAVIDTGIDVTHPDLGKSQIAERTMTKINTTPAPDIRAATSQDGNNLAFATGNTITIYSFGTETEKSIDLLQPTTRVDQLILKGNLLAYTTVQSNGTTSGEDGLFLYDLTTGVTKKVFSSFVSSVFIDQSQVFYMSNGAQSGVYKYDVNTDQTSQVTPPPGAPGTNVGLVKVDQGKILWRQFAVNQCRSTLFITTLATGQTQQYTIDSLQSVLDFSNNQILYVSCSPATYNIYDFGSGQKTTFNQSSSSLTYPIFVGKLNHDLAILIDGGNSKIYAYDVKRQTVFTINQFLQPYAVSLLGKRICFLSRTDGLVYCHQYDPASQYLPSNIYNTRVLGGHNFINNSDDANDDNSHGTHVAAIIAGNGVLSGVAPEVNLYSYKTQDAAGNGYIDTIISAIEYGVNTLSDSNPANDIQIMNLSLGVDCKRNYGGYTPDCGPDDALSQAVDNAASAGIIVIAAAGNNGPDNSTVISPGTARKAITVGAVDKSKQVSSFSSRGPVVLNGETINKPDVVAPGANICAAKSTLGQYSYGADCVDKKHIKYNGTSMAAPHVAGLAALLKQYKSSLTPAEAKDILKTSAVSLGLPVDTQGAGLIDAFAAFKKLNPAATPPPPPPPPPVACNPRPNIARSTAMTPDGMVVNLSPGTNAETPTNPISKIDFTSFANGTVTIDGSTYTSATTHTVTNPNSISMLIKQVTYGQATTITMKAYDTCGPYPLFFGGGTGANWPH